MPSISLKRMEDDIARLEGEIEKLTKKVDAFRQVVAYYKEQGEDLAPSLTPGREIDDAILSILKGEGKPLHRKEVHRRLEAMGIHVPGENPVSNTGAHLSALRPLTKPNGKLGIWSLTEWDTPVSAQGQQSN